MGGKGWKCLSGIFVLSSFSVQLQDIFLWPKVLSTSKAGTGNRLTALRNSDMMAAPLGQRIALCSYADLLSSWHLVLLKGHTLNIKGMGGGQTVFPEPGIVDKGLGSELDLPGGHSTILTLKNKNKNKKQSVNV